MKKKWRTLQPPHPSERITLEEAIEAWRKVEARAAERAAKSRSRSRSRAPVVTEASSGSPPERAERQELSDGEPGSR
jgi:hypothetical protein